MTEYLAHMTMYVSSYMHTYVHTYVYMHMYMYVYIYIYIYIYINTYIYNVYTCIYIVKKQVTKQCKKLYETIFYHLSTSTSFEKVTIENYSNFFKVNVFVYLVKAIIKPSSCVVSCS